MLEGSVGMIRVRKGHKPKAPAHTSQVSTVFDHLTLVFQSSYPP